LCVLTSNDARAFSGVTGNSSSVKKLLPGRSTCSLGRRCSRTTVASGGTCSGHCQNRKTTVFLARRPYFWSV